jgi:hypothetical protein
MQWMAAKQESEEKGKTVEHFLMTQDERSDADQRKHFGAATRELSRVVQYGGGDGIHEALESLLQSLIIQVWTAIEVLAEELHSKSRSMYPKCFQPTLPAEKYRFRRLESLCEAYDKAFSDSGISACVRSKEIKAIALLRHLLVHNRGVVDQTHIDQRSQPEIVSNFDAFSITQRILVDGEMVRILVDDGVRRTYELLILADTWIQNHNPI